MNRGQGFDRLTLDDDLILNDNICSKSARKPTSSFTSSYSAGIPRSMALVRPRFLNSWERAAWYTFSRRPGPRVVWTLNAQSTMIFASWFSCMGNFHAKPLRTQRKKRSDHFFFGFSSRPLRLCVRKRVSNADPKSHKEQRTPANNFRFWIFTHFFVKFKIRAWAPCRSHWQPKTNYRRRFR